MVKEANEMGALLAQVQKGHGLLSDAQQSSSPRDYKGAYEAFVQAKGLPRANCLDWLGQLIDTINERCPEDTKEAAVLEAPESKSWRCCGKKRAAQHAP